mmetsp:Transcript_21188/g.29964  ORF Transcript_21188/g.29964 Transcript_21188/m.29964 type:complete len:712 (+) Transcript_21188:623-2758(+)
MPISEIKTISVAVYRKTKGNILFVAQSLEALCWSKIIRRTVEDSWEWHQTDLDSWVKDSFDIVQLLENKIQRLPPATQNVLSAAACLGAEFDARVLSEAVPFLDISNALDQSIEDGLVVEQSHVEGLYKFAHDKVQQAAYALIPEDKKGELHLSIGRRLMPTKLKEGTDRHIFLIVDQMSRGIGALEDQNEKDGLASLCLQAGRKAARFSDFKGAAYYFELGISLLNKRHWRDQFYLSLDLYNAAAEASYCYGNFKESDKCIDAVLSNTRFLKDKIQAYATKMYALVGARHKMQEAVDLGIYVLGELGEKIPSEASKTNIVYEILKTKWMLRGQSSEVLSQLSTACDSNKISAMRILMLLSTAMYISKRNMWPFIPCRIVQLTVSLSVVTVMLHKTFRNICSCDHFSCRQLQYGTCAISAFGFVGYGLVMDGLGRYGEGDRFVELGLDVFERHHKIQEWLPRVHYVAFGLHAVYTKPWKSLEEPLLKVVQVGLVTGDIEFSTFALNGLCMLDALIGKPLFHAKERISGYVKVMAKYKQVSVHGNTIPFLQYMHNLLGLAKDPLVLSGDVMDEEVVLLEARKSTNYVLSLTVMVLKLSLACILNEYKHTSDILVKRKHWKGNGFQQMQITFWISLASLALAHESEKNRWRHFACARESLKDMKKFSLRCPENFTNKIFLVEAEIFALKGNLDDAYPCLPMFHISSRSRRVYT